MSNKDDKAAKPAAKTKKVFQYNVKGDRKGSVYDAGVSGKPIFKRDAPYELDPENPKHKEKIKAAKACGQLEWKEVEVPA